MERLGKRRKYGGILKEFWMFLKDFRLGMGKDTESFGLLMKFLDWNWRWMVLYMEEYFYLIFYGMKEFCCDKISGFWRKFEWNNIF